MLTLNPQSVWLLAAKFAPVLHQPLCSSGQRRLAANHDPRSLYLSPSLFGVAPIRQEHVAGFEDCKNTGCFRKPAKVSDVREMSDQQRIQRVALKNGLQLLQPAFVVHSQSLTRRIKTNFFHAMPVVQPFACSTTPEGVLLLACKRLV